MQAAVTPETSALPRRHCPAGPQYKWKVLTNTTLGVLMGAINSKAQYGFWGGDFPWVLRTSG